MIPSAPALTLTPELRSGFLKLVDRRFGIRISEYGESRIDDAVHAVLRTTDSQSAHELLGSYEEETGARWLYELVEHLTVGETYFLRDAGQIAALRDTILPDVAARRAIQRRLRFWSAGCSTGEEVYTLAVLLSEAQLAAGWDVTLIGTDVNRSSLRTARDARYPAWSFRTTPEAFRERYFETDGTRWRVNEAIRRMARFTWMNLGAETLAPPAGDFDVIMCRNVTIYFDDVATQRLYRALIELLAPGGWLMLGPSDPLPVDRDGLDRIDVTDAVLWRRRTEPKLTEVAKRQAAPPARPRAKTARPATLPRLHIAVPQPQVRTELEAGLLALESGEADDAITHLRRATFLEPGSAGAQFALARAFLDTGDVAHAQAALLQTRRLLALLDDADMVPGSDSVPAETLRQTVQTYLEALPT